MVRVPDELELPEAGEMADDRECERDMERWCEWW